jgi:CRP-like cAMP-binding protein
MTTHPSSINQPANKGESMRHPPSQDRIQLLRSVPLFRALNSKELARVDRLVAIVHLDTDEQLTKEGTVGRQAFIILSGQAAVTVAGRPIATVGPGEIIGEMALLDHQPRSATVTALEPMQAFLIDLQSFNSLLSEPAIARKLLDAEVGRLRVADAVPT